MQKQESETSLGDRKKWITVRSATVGRMNNLFTNAGVPHFVMLVSRAPARRKPILAAKGRNAAHHGLFFAECYEIETAVKGPSRHILQIDCHGHLPTAETICLVERK